MSDDAGIPSALAAGEPPRPGRSFSGKPLNLARTTGLVFAANISSSALGAVRSLYLAGAMMPAEYGIWTLVAAALGYANYADLGLNTGFILLVSRFLGRGEAATAERLKEQTLTASLLIPGACALTFFLLSFAPEAVVGRFGLTIRIIAVSILPLALLNYSQVIARLDDWWSGISAASLATAVVATVSVVLIGTATGRVTVEAAALASVGGTVVAVAILLWHRPVRPTWPCDRQTISRLVSIGLPVSLFPIGFVLFQSLDRWIVASAVSGSDLGFYGLGTTLGAFLYTVPTSLSVILFTRQIADFGATGDPKASESLVVPPIQVSASVMAWLAGSAILLLPFVIRHVTPEYTPTLPVAGLQVAGNCLLFAVPIGANYLISIGRQRSLFVVLGCVMVLEAVLVAVFVAVGWGITGAAWAVAISDAAFSAAVAMTCFARFGPGAPAALRVAQCFVPFALCLPLAIALRQFMDLTGNVVDDALLSSLAALVYATVAGVLCVCAGRVTGLFGHPFLATQVRRWLPGPLADAVIGPDKDAA